MFNLFRNNEQIKALFLLFSISLFSFIPLAYADDSEPLATKCDNYLLRLTEPPAYFEYVDCHQDNAKQAKPFIATYRIAGKNALEAETFLVSHFGITPMKFLCCGWETQTTYYRDPKTQIEYSFNIGAETLLQDKKDWLKIPYFNLTISSFSEGI